MEEVDANEKCSLTQTVGISRDPLGILRAASNRSLEDFWATGEEGGSTYEAFDRNQALRNRVNREK